MGNVRVIARLDIKGPNLVKGIHLEGLRVLGKPEEFAKYYYENGADELFYQDVVASLYERNSLQDIVTRTARQSFIPLTVGGGIRTLDDIRETLRAGADKVAINTQAIKTPSFIQEAARKFGSSTIVVALEVIRTGGKFLCYTDCGREHTGVDALQWAARVEELGAGEILLTSVDREGTGTGFDLELIREVSRLVNIPVIAHGGMGNGQHAVEVVHAGASALAAASVFHYDHLQRAHRQQGAHEGEGNVEFLKSGRGFGAIQPANIPEIKSALYSAGIPCRFTSTSSR
jgi:cyclase